MADQDNSQGMTSDALEAWLLARPDATRHQEAIWIASRAAARIWPLIFASLGRSQKLNLTVLQCSRSVLISSVAALGPTAEIKVAAAAARSAVARSAAAAALSGAADVSAAAAAADVSAALSAALSVALSAAAHSAADVSAAALSVALSAAAAAALSADATFLEQMGAEPSGAALWLQGIPEAATSWWPKAREALETHGAADDPKSNWSFWIAWYEDLLAGRPQDLDLLTKIALIPDEDWDQGPAHVNAVINGIVEAHRIDALIRANPYAHRITVGAAGHLIATPVDQPDLDHLIQAIRQTLKDFTARCRRDTSGNQLGAQMNAAFKQVISDLRRDLKRYQNDPLPLFDALSLGQREMARISKHEGFPDDGPASRLIDALETHRDDICIAAPSVLETERNRLSVRVARLAVDQRAIAIRLCAGMHSDSDGVLKAAAAVALTTILDPDSTEAEQKNAWYFLKAAVPRGAKAMRVANVPEASRKEAKSALEKVVDAADKASKIDKGVDALQELGAEGADWVREAYTQAASGNFFGLLG